MTATKPEELEAAIKELAAVIRNGSMPPLWADHLRTCLHHLKDYAEVLSTVTEEVPGSIPMWSWSPGGKPDTEAGDRHQVVMDQLLKIRKQLDTIDVRYEELVTRVKEANDE